jgi:hypothetical protein
MRSLNTTSNARSLNHMTKLRVWDAHIQSLYVSCFVANRYSGLAGDRTTQKSGFDSRQVQRDLMGSPSFLSRRHSSSGLTLQALRSFKLSGRGMKLTTHFLLEPMLGTCDTMPPLNGLDCVMLNSVQGQFNLSYVIS